MDSTNGYDTKPFKLTFKTQERMSKETCNDLVQGKLSRTMATVQLKTLTCNADAMKLIVDCGAIENALKNNALETLNLKDFHPLVDRTNLCGIQCPDFSS